MRHETVVMMLFAALLVAVVVFRPRANPPESSIDTCVPDHDPWGPVYLNSPETGYAGSITLGILRQRATMPATRKAVQ